MMACSCAASALAPVARARSLSRSSRGCQVSDADLGQFHGRDFGLGRSIGELSSNDIRRTTRNADMDRALDGALKRLSDTFGVVPGFGFYDDYDGENAWATPSVLLQGTDGTVLFGDRMFASLMRFDPSGGAVMWTAAHEFAHIWLYKSGQKGRLLAGQATVRPVELHADFLAGFYLGIRKREQPSVSLYNAGHDIWSSGDTLYNDPGHHGTPEERVAAAEAGFKISYADHRGAREAFEAATQYVLSR
jgi:hypothetical protein